MKLDHFCLNRADTLRVPGMRRVALAAMACLLAAGTTPVLAHKVVLKDLEIVHPSTVEPADRAIKDVKIYMTIHNHGKEADRLLSASSPLASTVEIETGLSAGDHAIDLPAGSTVAFKRHGPHIELKGLTEELTGYEMFPLWLTFEKAGKVEVEVMVEENEDAMSGHEPGHDHDGSNKVDHK